MELLKLEHIEDIFSLQTRQDPSSVGKELDDC